MYKHKETGEIYEHISNFGPFRLFESVRTGNVIHVSAEFMQHYEPLFVH